MRRTPSSSHDLDSTADAQGYARGGRSCQMLRCRCKSRHPFTRPQDVDWRSIAVRLFTASCRSGADPLARVVIPWRDAGDAVQVVQGAEKYRAVGDGGGGADVVGEGVLADQLELRGGFDDEG